ncbi:MAG: toxic anion resistance protein [Clostridiales Family XIII bacterium]|jgi:uncharacterized protein YaaN involved in tellurite resistance|nr:toxic anion resistance protein [Clostridiales Family XIII bacterium]
MTDIDKTNAIDATTDAVVVSEVDVDLTGGYDAPAIVAEAEMITAEKAEVRFTPEEQQKIDAIVSKIDINDSTQLIQYGAGLQQKMSSFSTSALSSVRTKDLEGAGALITDLVVELRGFDATENKKGLAKLFSKTGNNITALKSKYDTVEKNVDKIVGVLDGHKLTLLKDLKTLDQLYINNLQYFRDLTVFIAAGKQKIDSLNQVDLARAQKKASESGLPEDAQEARRIADLVTRFEKRIYDLELTRTVCIQMAPQIRLIQENDSVMIDKIQSSIINTIPLWKSQMVLALGIAHTQSAIKAQREVTDTTNALLKKNADLLKTGTIEAAKESERGIIDIETLQHTNESLISTLDEVLMIQKEGREQRVLAEGELQVIENTLKDKLLEIQTKA